MTWPPAAQVAALVVLTAAIVFLWALLLARAGGQPLGESVWSALTYFVDGGTMASDDQARLGWTGRRLIALGATASGLLLLSFLTGAFASKLGERIEDLRSGRSPIIEEGHVLVLGYDAKVAFMARDFARSHAQLTMVVLAQEDKVRLETLFKVVKRTPQSRLRVICRTGDPKSELALLRVCADRARTIVIIAPAVLDDDHALRWTLATLLCVRRVVGSEFKGTVVAESRRNANGALLALAGEAGLAGNSPLRIEVVASDDIVARVLAQSIRQSGVYFALRELLSFRGSDIYFEPVPRELAGRTFDDAYSRCNGGILIGVFRHGQGHELVPRRGDPLPLQQEDRLIVLEQEPGDLRVGAALPSRLAHGFMRVESGPHRPAAPPKPKDQEVWSDSGGSLPLALDVAPAEHKEPPPNMGEAGCPQRVAILGNNRTLPCLIRELERIMAPGSRLDVSCPALAPLEEQTLVEAMRATRAVTVVRHERTPDELGRASDLAADAVVILGCEDEHDLDGDASALALLLRLRHARRARKGMGTVRRLVTEVRDPSAAQLIAASADDFLVSSDVVAMMLAHSALDLEIAKVYREILDPIGAEVFLRPRVLYVPDGPATFGDVMTAARSRNECAIGFYPHDPFFGRTETQPRELFESGDFGYDDATPVWLNPPRATQIPDTDETLIVVLGKD